MCTQEDMQRRICPHCNVALLYPMQDPELVKNGWYKCEFCSYSIIIESENILNRIKNQK